MRTARRPRGRTSTEDGGNTGGEIVPVPRKGGIEPAGEARGLAAIAEGKLLGMAVAAAQYAGAHTITRESLEVQMAEIKRALAGPAPSTLEALLVERIVLCWLQLQYADAVAAMAMGNDSLPEQEYYQRRQDRAHRRYLSAIKALAQVRRLLTPALQVNIGGQQVNLAGSR